MKYSPQSLAFACHHGIDDAQQVATAAEPIDAGGDQFETVIGRFFDELRDGSCGVSATTPNLRGSSTSCTVSTIIGRYACNLLKACKRPTHNSIAKTPQSLRHRLAETHDTETRHEPAPAASSCTIKCAFTRVIVPDPRFDHVTFIADDENDIIVGATHACDRANGRQWYYRRL